LRFRITRKVFINQIKIKRAIRLPLLTAAFSGSCENPGKKFLPGFGKEFLPDRNGRD
jgi:hypothetical protein